MKSKIKDANLQDKIAQAKEITAAKAKAGWSWFASGWSSSYSCDILFVNI